MYLIFVAIVVSITGCGSQYGSSAKGMVTLDGRALSYGWVAFHPRSGGPPAMAPIDSSGFYVVRTGNVEGLPPGDYQVTVTANEPPKELRSKDGGPMPSGKLITPVWYGMKDKSGLTFSVAPGKNEINLDLKSTPPAGRQ